MARTLEQFITEIRGSIAKGKLRGARKTLDKAQKLGHKGPEIAEIEVELLLAEGGGAAAAGALLELARGGDGRIGALLKTAEAHLRRHKDDQDVRDALWEVALARGEAEMAVRHAHQLVQAGAVDGGRRGQRLLDRKDAVGAAGIFLLATLGALKTDRIKLADRLLQNDAAARLLSATVQALHALGREDGAIHYVLAQLAREAGDRERFLDHAGKAFEESPDEVWTWTLSNVGPEERLEMALRTGSLRHLLEAAGSADGPHLVDVAKRSGGEGTAARTLRGLALLLQRKPANACRILEAVAQEDPEAAAPVADFLRSKAADWPGASEVFAAVAGSALQGDAERLSEAADALLAAPEGQRGEAWSRAAPRVLEGVPGREDLRRALGLELLASGGQQEAAALLREPSHLGTARAWAEAGRAKAPVLLRAAELAEKSGTIAEAADWLLPAAGGDSALLAQLGRKIRGAAVSAEAALSSARALLDQGKGGEAAELLGLLPLDAATAGPVDALLKERRLLDDAAFQTASFRCALALGDAPRAKRLFKGVRSNVQALAKEAEAHADAARVLADVLIAQEKGEVAVGLLEARRAAGDEPRSLLPLADALLKASPRLGMARIVRARLLQAVGRDDDAVRDLRAVPFDAGEAVDAFRLLGELGKGPAAGAASLGRADIHLARKEYGKAVDELLRGGAAPAAERLSRFEAVCRERALDAAHRGRGICLLELGRVPEAAEAHLKRFQCADADRAAVAGDVEDVARKSLAASDLGTAATVLEQLPEHVSDGADRAIAVIAEDRRPPMLILRSKLLLHRGRTSEAVSTLSDLVAADPGSRPQAAKALEAIIESGQARPEADFALAAAYDALGQTSRALAALNRVYEDDITGKDRIVRHAEALVRKADDPAVRLFLGRVCLDMRDPRGATEHAIQARKLRPAARRECVGLLQKCLDLDAFAPATHFALAEAHLAGDEADDAVRHFRAAVEVDKGRARGAIRVMEEAAPRSAHAAMLWLAVGTTCAEFLRDHAAAVAAFTKGLEASPPQELRVPLLLGRGDSHAAQGEEDRAFEDFDEGSRHDLLERRYYEFLRARHRRRELEAAEAARENAAKDLAEAAQACGRFIRLGRAQEAVHVAQLALAAAPQDVGARYLVGVSLHAAGRYDAAAQVLETVRAAAGAGTEVGRAARMLLAESYLDQGDRARARACLTEIEALDAQYPGLDARRGALAPPADDPHAPPPLFVRPEFPRPSE